MDDDKLVSLFAAGSEQAFVDLMNKYNGKIFKTIYGITGNYQDSLDLTQDVFFQVYKSLPAYQFKGQFNSWILKIATNRSRNYIKRNRILTFLSLDWITKKSQAAFEDKTEKANIEGHIEKKEKNDQIHQALNSLDYKSKEILVLKEIDMLDYKQIAEILGLEMGTVKSRISRARIKLKEQLIKQEIHKWI